MGGWLGRKCITGYAWKRFPSCSAAERTAIGNYMYHSSAAAGSGEYALAHLLRPGAYAYAPLADRLPTIAQSRIAVDFVYGEDGVDWMNGTHADKLVASGQLPSSTRVLRVVGAGHQLIIDDPTAFAKALDSINP
jgi:cardiolipin-specific phospholipase